MVLEARATRAQVEPTALAVPGVRRLLDLEQLEGDPTPLCRLRLEVESLAAAEGLSLELARKGFALRELRREQTSLEDVFAMLTTRERADGASEAEPQKPSAEGA